MKISLTGLYEERHISDILTWLSEHEKYCALLIILIGFIVRFLPFWFMGFPFDIPYGGGGLYYDFSRTILEGNFAYPETIPFYTIHGIPFVYPPLVFYSIAVLSKITGISLLILHIYLPPFISGCSVAAFFLLSRKIFQKSIPALISSLFFALYIPGFSYLIAGHGLVPGVGVCLLILGLWSLLISFRNGSFTHIFISGGIFGASLVSSPYAAFGFVISLLACSIDSLIRGSPKLREMV